MEEYSTTKANPQVQVVSVRCSGCDFEHVLEVPTPVYIDYLHQSWVHDCGAAVLFETEPVGLTLESLTKLMDAIEHGRIIGMAVGAIDQISIVGKRNP